MRIVKCRIMKSVRLWLSDSGRKLAVANGELSQRRPWCVDVYDLLTNATPAALGGGLGGRLIDGFDDQDRLRVIPGKAFPMNLGGMACTEATEVQSLNRIVYLNELFRTAASPVILSADGSRCVAAIGYTLRLFTKKAGREWVEKWQRNTRTRMTGPIRFLRSNTRFTLVEEVFGRNGKQAIPHRRLLVWDGRTGREVGRTEPSVRPFSHLVPIGKQLVAGRNAAFGDPALGEVLAYDSDHLDREPHEVLASESPIAAVCADPLGRFVLTATAKLVIQWDPTTWLPICTFNWKIGTITSLTINSTGTLAAAGGHQGKVVVWDIE